MSNDAVNYWKFATIGILLVGVTAAATLLIVGRDSKNGKTDSPPPQASAPSVTTAPAENPPTSPTGPADPTGSAGLTSAAPEERHAVQRSAPRPSRQHAAAAPPPPPPYPPQGAVYPAGPAYPPQSVMEAC